MYADYSLRQSEPPPTFFFFFYYLIYYYFLIPLFLLELISYSVTIRFSRSETDQEWRTFGCRRLSVSLFVGNSLHLASHSFLSSKEQVQTVASQGRRECRKNTGAVKNQWCSLGAVFWLLLKKYAQYP